MIGIIHPFAGAVAILTIATFWFSTALSELFCSQTTIIVVKTAIPWGFLLLVPAIALAGGSGLTLAKGRRGSVIDSKIRRMPLVAVNGVLILIPSALYLSFKANAASFDSAFYAVQILELVAGAANMMLLGLNMRDGLQMKGRLRHKKR